jgi:hypothetical protein
MLRKGHQCFPQVFPWEPKEDEFEDAKFEGASNHFWSEIFRFIISNPVVHEQSFVEGRLSDLQSFVSPDHPEGQPLMQSYFCNVY